MKKNLINLPFCPDCCCEVKYRTVSKGIKVYYRGKICDGQKKQLTKIGYLVY